MAARWSASAMSCASAAIRPARSPRFEAASEIEPGNLAIRNAIGYLLRDMQRLDEAEMVFQRILEQAPTHCGALTGLGFVSGERGDREESLKAFEAAAAIEPRNAAVRIQIAHLLRQSDRLDEAEATYCRVLDDEPTSVAAMVELGKLQKQRGDRAAAVATFERAWRFIPVTRDCASNSATCFARSAASPKPKRRSALFSRRSRTLRRPLRSWLADGRLPEARRGRSPFPARRGRQSERCRLPSGPRACRAAARRPDRLADLFRIGARRRSRTISTPGSNAPPNAATAGRSPKRAR